MASDVPPKKHSQSEFPKFSRDNMQVITHENDIVRIWRAFLPNDIVLAPSYWKVHQKYLPRFKYFIVDVNDIQCLQDTLNNYSTTEERKWMFFRFRSLTNWVKVYENHRLYLRAIPSGHNGVQDAPRIFVEDALEVIPIVLEKQGTPLKYGDDRIEEYRKKWGTNLENKKWVTLSTTELAGLFVELDCNKALVTIIEDPMHINTSKDCLSRGGYIRTISPNQTVVMDTSMAALFVFDALVKGINHKKYRCDGSICGKEDGMNCLGRITKLLKWIMEDKGAYISTDHLRTQIFTHQKIANDCSKHPGPFTNYTFDGIPYAESLDILLYILPAKIYDLPYYANFQEVGQKTLPIWMAKVFIGIGWLEQFFGDAELEVKEFLGRALLSMVPVECRDATWNFIKQVLNHIFPGCTIYPKALDIMPVVPLSKKQKKALKRKNRKEKKKMENSIPDIVIYEDDFEDDEEDLEASESQESEPGFEIPPDIEKQIDEDLVKFVEELELDEEKAKDEQGRKDKKEEKIQLLKGHYAMVTKETKALVAEIKDLREQLAVQKELCAMKPDEKDGIIKELIQANKEIGASLEAAEEAKEDIVKEMKAAYCNYMLEAQEIGMEDKETIRKLEAKIAYQQEIINQLIKNSK